MQVQGTASAVGGLALPYTELAVALYASDMPTVKPDGSPGQVAAWAAQGLARLGAPGERRNDQYRRGPLRRVPSADPAARHRAPRQLLLTRLPPGRAPRPRAYRRGRTAARRPARGRPCHRGAHLAPLEEAAHDAADAARAVFTCAADGTRADLVCALTELHHAAAGLERLALRYWDASDEAVRLGGLRCPPLRRGR